MGVLTLRLLVCGQLILFSLVVNNITNAQKIGESPSKAPPLNATRNHTEDNASNSSSNSAYNDSSTTQNNLNTQTTPTGFNSTLGPIQSNTTVTGSAVQPNSTENGQTTQSATFTTIKINSTAVTSTDKSTHGNNETAASSTTPVTKQTAITSPTITQNGTTFSNESQGGGLNHSEKSLTILFSILLGVIVLVILMNFVYKYGRSKERSIQYTHRRLQNEDTGEPFAVPDDTLVISGGLYDGPQIYNPTMTVQNEEEFQTDIPGSASRPTRFRLEFLRENQDRAFDNEPSTFQTFHAHDQEP
ncbi:sialomucin core protein 24-like isoform X2 [Rhinichthys klamathensis goyatoka]|uniref:sialomucin core protein 24-like isoform X2 n=1 Tax=Rhinichthys klamathensis goyatoka TaxID=3034132 RepID=UPI0024B4D177|nr:sialomucin core protein 24-like isoform X2 [Rhinichthys klamathensis goyatoka]